MSKLLLVPVLGLVALVGAMVSAGASSRDRDHDRMPDRWERHYGLSTKNKSAKRDPDKDHLRNRREYRLHLNPRRADTDRDGLRDGAEVNRWKTNPRRKDTDGDGFSDRREIRAGTDPRDRRSYPGGGGGASPGAFPNASTTGVPGGWTPAQTRSTSLTVTTPGAVVEDVLFTNGADLFIDAANVTIRRVKLEGGWIRNDCNSGLLLEDVTINRGSSESGEGGEGVVSYGGYTARRVEILDRSEGFRAGDDSPGCYPIRIEDSFVRITPPDGCTDWHGDGIQGYDSRHLIVSNVAIEMQETSQCSGTSPFFYNGGSGGSLNGRADVNRLLLRGGGYPFRMGTPGSVQGLKVVNHSWKYGPISITDAGCEAVTPWEAKIVEADSNNVVTRTVRDLPCD
jgi:hypothetical protein